MINLQNHSKSTKAKSIENTLEELVAEDEIDLGDDDETTSSKTQQNADKFFDVIQSGDDDDTTSSLKATSSGFGVSSTFEQTLAPTSVSSLVKTSGPPQVTDVSVKNDHFIEITVGQPQKVGDGIGAYVTYKVSTKTNLPFFRRTSLSVNRRFSDFLGLRDKLAEKHLHLGRIVPPAPEKSAVGMAKVKMSKDENVSSAEFIEKRRAALERYLNRNAQHPVLVTDPDFREFLELDTDLPKASNTSALSGAGVKRLFNRMGDTVNKMTFRMDESDPVSIAAM